MCYEVVEPNMIERLDIGLVILLYRKAFFYNTIYYFAYNVSSMNLLEEKVAVRNLPAVQGSNEMLFCTSENSSENISCIFVPEGNHFSELIFRISGLKGTPPGKFELSLMSSKIYKQFLNCEVERISFNDKLIILQTKIPALDSYSDFSPRHLLVFMRDTQNQHLYKGIPCSDYSEFCTRPLDIFFDDKIPTVFTINSEKNNYLLAHFSLLQRSFKKPDSCKLNTSQIKNLMLSAENMISPKENSSVKLSSIIAFESNNTKEKLKVNWKLWIGMMLVLLVPIGYGLYRDVKKKNLDMLSSQQKGMISVYKQITHEPPIRMLRRQNSDDSSQDNRSVASEKDVRGDWFQVGVVKDSTN